MSDSESLRGRAVKDTWENLLHFDNNNTGISNTVQPIYDGAGNPIPVEVSTIRVNLSNATINNAVIKITVGIPSPIIDNGTIISVVSGEDAINSPDNDFLIKNFNLLSYERNVFLHDVQRISNTNNHKLTLSPNRAKFFIVDRTGDLSLTDIQISSMSSVFNPDFSSYGYAELFVYLHSGGATVNIPLGTTTPIYWHSPTPDGGTERPATGDGGFTMSDFSSCLFTLQTFDKGTTWHGRVIAQNLGSPNP